MEFLRYYVMLVFMVLLRVMSSHLIKMHEQAHALQAIMKMSRKRNLAKFDMNEIRNLAQFRFRYMSVHCAQTQTPFQFQFSFLEYYLLLVVFLYSCLQRR